MMDITLIGYGMLFVAVVISVSSILILRRQKKLNEKALIYGVIANIMVQLFAFFFVYTGDFLVVVMNALFLAVIGYNMVTIFGIRMAKIYEKDQKNFLSFFTGNAILANALSFILIGIASLSFGTYSQDEAFIASVGQDVIDQLANVMKSITVDHLGMMLVATLASILVTYASLTIFVRAHHTRVGSIIGKGILVLFSFYLINLYVPVTNAQEIMQMTLYMAIAGASYFFMRQVLEQKTVDKKPK